MDATAAWPRLRSSRSFEALGRILDAKASYCMDENSMQMNAGVHLGMHVRACSVFARTTCRTRGSGNHKSQAVMGSMVCPVFAKPKRSNTPGRDEEQKMAQGRAWKRTTAGTKATKKSGRHISTAALLNKKYRQRMPGKAQGSNG